MNTLLILSVSYVLLTVITVWLWFGNVLGPKGKVALSLILPIVYYPHWMGLVQSIGWPSSQELPERFELISSDIIEPNDYMKVPGNIHLWVRTRANTPPRAYSLPYSRELHDELTATRQRSAQGRRQVGSLSNSDSRGRGTNIAGGKTLEFHSEPKKRLPAKN